MKPTAMAAASASGNGKNAIRRLMGIMHLQAKLEANTPTFSKFLGLSTNEAVQEDRFSFVDRSSNTTGSSSEKQQQQQQSLVFRYRFPPNDRLGYLDKGDNSDEQENSKPSLCVSGRSGAPSLSTYTSILDEVTTLHLISAPASPLRPGVSVTMESQWGPSHAEGSRLEPPQEVDIVTTITKRGRTLGFVRAEVRDPSNNDGLICFFDHVKYLPVGWVQSVVLSPIGILCLDLLAKHILPWFQKKNDGSNEQDAQEKRYKSIMDSYRQTSDTTATFRFGSQHSNGFGGLHGGVQSVLMERLGKRAARNEFQKLLDNFAGSSKSDSNDMVCERLKVTYQSSASRFLELRAHVIDPPRADCPSVTLRIEILRSRDPSRDNGSEGTKPKRVVVVSEGILTFVHSPSKPKDQ